MIVGMIACSLAWSATQASLVMEDGERRRLDEPLSTCGGAVSKIGELESSCGGTEEDAQVPRTDTTCASDACASSIASMTNASVQEMINGLATCTGVLAQSTASLTEDVIKIALLTTASECGLTSPLSFPLDTCPGAVTKFNEMSSCGSTDDDAQVPRTDTTCASDACASFVASMTDATLQDMIVGIGKCTGDELQFNKTMLTEDLLKLALLATASECGLTSPLSFPFDTCLGAITKFNELRSSCGATDAAAEIPLTAETCASDACAGVVSSMTHDVVQRMSTGASNCTGDYMAFQAFSTASTLTLAVLNTAHECNLTSPLIADVCSEANEGSPCGSFYSGKTCQCTGRRRVRNLLFGTLPGASCRCAEMLL